MCCAVQMFFVDELTLGNLNPSLDYHQANFYVLNFNDLAHSLIALFYQLVVSCGAHMKRTCNQACSGIGPASFIRLTDFLNIYVLRFVIMLLFFPPFLFR
jgi:hypothetical protein